MKRSLLFFSLILISFLSQAQQSEEGAVKEAIKKTYADPLYMGGSVEDIKAGLHEGFEMYVYLRGEFSKHSKEQWVQRLEEVRSRPRSSTQVKHKNEYRFAMVDVTGQTAMAKLEILRDGKLNYTDYLTLYKIEGEWKLLSKFFTYHGDED